MSPTELLNQDNLPWITNEITRNVRKRYRFFLRARKSNSNTDWSNVRKFTNSFAKLITSHKNYINNIIGSNLVENPKCFWSYVRLKRTDNIGVPTLKTGTKMCNSDIDRAETLNNHFLIISTKPKRKATLIVCHLLNQSPHFPLMQMVFYLRRLNPSKAHKPDELSPQLLKLVAEELAPALTIIFQQAYDQSSIPKDWNSSIVTPIFKKRLISDPSNNRPMSLTCIFCKIMEHAMLSHIAKHIAKTIS